jgi:hypothetical protein
VRNRFSTAILLLLIAAPLFARTVTVQQLSQTLGVVILRHRSDLDTANEISKFELSERLTEHSLARLQSRSPGPVTARTLEELMEQSAFLNPPPAELAVKLHPHWSSSGPFFKTPSSICSNMRAVSRI